MLRKAVDAIHGRVRDYLNTWEHMRDKKRYYRLMWAFSNKRYHSHFLFWKTTNWIILNNHWEKECICQSQGTFSPPQRLKILAEFWLLGATAKNWLPGMEARYISWKLTESRDSWKRIGQVYRSIEARKLQAVCLWLWRRTQWWRYSIQA